jgi:hypothetical protein
MIIETNIYTLEKKIADESSIDLNLISFWNDIRHIIFTDDTQIRESIEKKYDRKENESRQWSTFEIIQGDV